MTFGVINQKRGRKPLKSYEVVANLITSTRADLGLKVLCDLNQHLTNQGCWGTGNFKEQPAPTESGHKKCGSVLPPTVGGYRVDFTA